MANDAEKRGELVEHLAELRTRLIRISIYVLGGMCVAWFLYDPIYAALTRPMRPILSQHHTKFLFTSITQPFMLRMQVSLIAGLILMLPFVTLEIWGFIAPGLTKQERRPLRWVVPLSILLFAGGVSMAYWILPFGFKWFAHYIPHNAEIRPNVPDTIRFVVLMLLAFGVVFELPVFLMLLAQVGIINSKMLKDNWRYSTVGISIAAAVITPSNDVFSMMSMAIPLVLLYLMSIWLVKLVEKKPGKE